MEIFFQIECKDNDIIFLKKAYGIVFSRGIGEIFNVPNQLLKIE
jgi:hypothetical protein